MEINETSLNSVLSTMRVARKMADTYDKIPYLKGVIRDDMNIRKVVDLGLLKACLYGAQLSGAVNDRTIEEISELNQGTCLYLNLSDTKARSDLKQEILHDENKEGFEEALKFLIGFDNAMDKISHDAPSIARYFYMGSMSALCIITIQEEEASETSINEFISFANASLKQIKEVKLTPISTDDGADDEDSATETLIAASMQRIAIIHQNEDIEPKYDNNETIRDDDIEEDETEDESLEMLMNNLDDLVGLQSVKDDLRSLINLIQITKIREERGYKQEPMSLHMVFSGNPGTGKTTVARLLAKIYKKMGILSKGQLIEVDRSDLVGGYVGQTALKVKAVLDKSLGGILFIDEAYSLTSNKDPNDYGHEAIDTLLKGMEDHRHDLIVIAAGYPKLMDDFLNSNPGLRSRFNKIISFPDYSAPELLDIFLRICDKNGLKPDDNCIQYVNQYFNNCLLDKGQYFGNARLVRNFVEKARVNQANRISASNNISNKVLETLMLDDVNNISL